MRAAHHALVLQDAQGVHGVLVALKDVLTVRLGRELRSRTDGGAIEHLCHPNQTTIFVLRAKTQVQRRIDACATVFVCVPLFARTHVRSVQSSPADTIVPAAASSSATARTAPAWPSMQHSHLYGSSARQMRMVLSAEPEAIRPSPSQARAVTQSEWPEPGGFFFGIAGKEGGAGSERARVSLRV